MTDLETTAGRMWRNKFTPINSGNEKQRGPSDEKPPAYETQEIQSTPHSDT
ncbi:MAG: hypothetical protein LBQ20_06190 [Rhodanobacter sp.]|nr:hypothetical protein [Rhodanobacter sp.]